MINYSIFELSLTIAKQFVNFFLIYQTLNDEFKDNFFWMKDYYWELFVCFLTSIEQSFEMNVYLNANEI